MAAESNRDFLWARQWSHDEKICVSLAGEDVIPQWRKSIKEGHGS